MLGHSVSKDALGVQQKNSYVFCISKFRVINAFSARCNFSWNGPSPLIYPFLPLHIGEKVNVACSCDGKRFFNFKFAQMSYYSIK